MARLFATSINLNKNELLNARIHNNISDPSSPVAGQIYFNTTDNVLKFYDGTNWIAGGSVEFGNTASRPVASKEGTLYVDTQTKTLYVDNGTSWVQGTLSESDVQGWISDHNDLTSGVHGVTGDVVGTSDTQTLSNKTISDSLKFNDGSNDSTIYADGNNLTIYANNDLYLNTNNGNINLQPDGEAQVYGDRIVTETATQTLTNKNINDELTFTNPSTQAVDGGLVINDSNEHFEIKAYTSDLDITAQNGDITLDADGHVIVNTQLDVDANLNTTNILGATFNSADGSIAIKDGSQTSSIHINGVSHDIELLPSGGGKAFYGSAATAGNEIAKISDLQALSSGLSWKQAVNVLANSNVPLSGSTPLIVDGHTLSDGYRVLLIGQSTASQNGIYDLAISGASYTLTRSTDSNSDAELEGAAVFVMEGSTYGATSWVQSGHYITSFANQDWVQFSGQGTYIGSNSIEIDGQQINVITDGDRGLNIDGDGAYVKIGDGIQFVGGNVSINPGTGFDTTSGYLEFASGYGVRKYSRNLDYAIASNSNTTFTVQHNLGTRDITVQIFDNSSPYAQIETDVEHYDTNNAVIKFASAPSDGQYRIVIVG